ncbi:hypothetical protein FACS189434_00750 [Bacteroidia bacterium]|nr:hypothetical protein FACS189434_00750 [Bacteroidia bacterium]
MKIKSYIFTISIFCCTFAFAQKEEINSGNKLYKSKEYDKAETAYREALLKNKNSTEGNFNLGNTLYRQGKFDQAKEQFQVIAETAQDKKTAAAAYHNLGNAFMSQKDYGNSAEAYKKSLKLNPKDEDTRYNLALANALMKKEKQNEQQQAPPPPESTMPQENAQQILDAFQEDEQELLNNMNTQTPDKRPLDKDW